MGRRMFWLEEDGRSAPETVNGEGVIGFFPILTDGGWVLNRLHIQCCGTTARNGTPLALRRLPGRVTHTISTIVSQALFKEPSNIRVVQAHLLGME
eukprot:605261-Amphidinium_carterae.1